MVSILLDVARVHHSLRADRGAAVVELTIAASLLLTLLLGIVSYGVLLSFKQGMTQVAAEAARAAAIEHIGKTPAAVAQESYEPAADRILDRTCDAGDADDDGLACGTTLDCSTGPCRLEVEVVYDHGDHPLVPPIPLISSVLPKTVRSVSSVQVP